VTYSFEKFGLTIQIGFTWTSTDLLFVSLRNHNFGNYCQWNLTIDTVNHFILSYKIFSVEKVL
jgi:hypothetical protein